VLGHDDSTYHCSTSESQWRPSVDPDMLTASKDIPVAGIRPPAWELGVRRRNEVIVHPTHPVGGAANVQLNDGSGTSSYKEGIKEAQLAAALNQSAREYSAGLEIAGKRVEPKWLGSVSKHTQPPGGGRETQDILPVPSNRASTTTNNPGSPPRSPLKNRSHFSPVPEAGPQAVGAYSSSFLIDPSAAGGPAVPLRTSRDSSIATLLGGGDSCSSQNMSSSAMLSPRDRKVTADGVCKQVGGWVGGGYSGIDEVNAKLGVSRRRD